MNGKEKFVKNFNISFQKGNEFIQRKENENNSIERFVSESNLFFDKLSHPDMGKYQCNMPNCQESSQICRILPEKFLSKIEMPKPMYIPKGKVYY